MTANSRTAAVVKGQLSKFSGIISQDLPKAKQRLVREMIYGIQAAKDVKLSNITRSLNEPQPLIKTEDRLSRNLDDRDFTEAINHQICRLGSRNVLDDMVIAIDPGDIRKKHASKMECLCKIHDGSAHERYDPDPASRQLPDGNLLRDTAEVVELDESPAPAPRRKPQILADLIGAKRCIFVKDEDGLYTDDPKKNDKAEFIPDITVKELLARDLDDLVIERPCLEIIQNSEVIDQIQIINGLKEGNITKALRGEHVGTIIRKP